MRAAVHSLANFFLLAEDERFRTLSESFRSAEHNFSPSDLWYVLGGVLLIGLAVWALSRWAERSELRGGLNSPRRLFRELCRAHGIDRPGRRLLTALARAHALEQPALLFVEPERF